VVLVVVALLSAFISIAAQRAGEALSLVGLPEDSFASGVLVGYTFALCRAGGAVAGGLTTDLVGSRGAVAVTAGALAATVAVLSLFSGHDAPWRPLIGSIGGAVGMGLTVVPMACVALVGRRHLGYYYGFLYLAGAFGSVMVFPLEARIEAHPQLVLRLTAVFCLLAVVAAVRWLRELDRAAE
jgi:hypothetical protein